MNNEKLTNTKGAEAREMEFHFPRTKTNEFQSRLECIRNENGIRTSFVVRYIFEGHEGTAIVPKEAMRSISPDQVKRLQDVK